MSRPEISRLHELFAYSAQSGVLIRKITTSNRCPAGSRAGTLDRSTGYRRVRVDGVVLYEHIVVWAMTRGKWPSGLIDHRHGTRDDNREDGLRDGPRRFNQENQRRARSDNKLGVLGVCQVPSGKFAASIRVDGRQRRLGTFSSAEDAHAAYVAAKRMFHEGCTL